MTSIVSGLVACTRRRQTNKQTDGRLDTITNDRQWTLSCWPGHDQVIRHSRDPIFSGRRLHLGQFPPLSAGSVCVCVSVCGRKPGNQTRPSSAECKGLTRLRVLVRSGTWCEMHARTRVDNPGVFWYACVYAYVYNCVCVCGGVFCTRALVRDISDNVYE